MALKLLLDIRSGQYAGNGMVIEPPGALVGRDPLCALHLPDRKVSSRHAQLSYEQDAWVLQDLKSTNGTFVGQDRLGGEPVRLGREGRMQFADVLVNYRTEEGAVVRKLEVQDLMTPETVQRPLRGRHAELGTQQGDGDSPSTEGLDRNALLEPIPPGNDTMPLSRELPSLDILQLGPDAGQAASSNLGPDAGPTAQGQLDARSASSQKPASGGRLFPSPDQHLDPLGGGAVRETLEADRVSLQDLAAAGIVPNRGKSDELERLRQTLAAREQALTELAGKHQALQSRSEGLNSERESLAATVAELRKRLEQAGKELQEARKQAQECEARAKASEGQGGEWEPRVKAAEVEAREWEARAKAAEVEAREWEARAKAAEEQALEWEARVKAAEEQAIEREARVKAAEERVREWEARVKATEERVLEWEARAKAVESQAAGSEPRAESAPRAASAPDSAQLEEIRDVLDNSLSYAGDFGTALAAMAEALSGSGGAQQARARLREVSARLADLRSLLESGRGHV